MISQALFKEEKEKMVDAHREFLSLLFRTCVLLLGHLHGEIDISSLPPGMARPSPPVQPSTFSPCPPDVGRPAEDLRGLPGAELKGLGGLDSREMSMMRSRWVKCSSRGMAFSWCSELQVRVGGLHLPGHLRELPLDHAVLHELLAEGAPLVGVLEGLL